MMNKIFRVLKIVIVGVLVLSSIPLLITYLAEIDRPHEFMLIVHVIFGILFILVAVPITISDVKQMRKGKNLPEG